MKSETKNNNNKEIIHVLICTHNHNLIFINGENMGSNVMKDEVNFNVPTIIFIKYIQMYTRDDGQF